MAAHHPSSTTQLTSVVTGHGMRIAELKAVDSNAVASVICPRTVAVAAIAEVQANMGASLCRAEEDQIPGAKLADVSWGHGEGDPESGKT